MNYRVIFTDEMGAFGEAVCETKADALLLREKARAEGNDAVIEKL